MLHGLQNIVQSAWVCSCATGMPIGCRAIFSWWSVLLLHALNPRLPCLPLHLTVSIWCNCCCCCCYLVGTSQLYLIHLAAVLRALSLPFMILQATSYPLDVEAGMCSPH